MSNNDDLLAELGWAKQLNVQEIKGDNFVENYRGWEIRFCIPNGGIIGVSIWDKDYWWCSICALIGRLDRERMGKNPRVGSRGLTY